MLGPIPASRMKMVESIARLTASTSPRRGKGLTLDFARMYFRGVADEDLAALEPASLAAMALHHLAFGAQRRGRSPMVRVFNPEPARDGVLEEDGGPGRLALPKEVLQPGCDPGVSRRFVCLASAHRQPVRLERVCSAGAGSRADPADKVDGAWSRVGRRPGRRR